MDDLVLSQQTTQAVQTSPVATVSVSVQQAPPEVTPVVQQNIPAVATARIQEPPSHGVGVHKEAVSMPPLTPDIPNVNQESPLLVSSEPDVLLPPELKEIGIEEGEDAKEQAFFKAMQQASSEFGTNEQLQQATGGQTQQAPLPMSFQQATEVKKRGKILNSVTWFAALIVYQWKKLHPTSS